MANLKGVQQIVPGRGDKQNVYRQVNMGWIPFMGFAPKALDQVKFGTAGVVNSTAQEGDFKWGPTFGGGAPWKFAKDYNDTYAANTMLPYIHWLYQGNARSWAMYSLFSNPDGNISSGLGSDIGITLASNIVKKGVRKPEPADMFSGGKKGYDIKKSTSEQQAEIMRLFGEEIIPDGEWLSELQTAASENRVPIGKKNIGKDSLVGPPGAAIGKPNFPANTGKGLEWRLSPDVLAEASKELALNVAGDLVGLYNQAGGNQLERGEFQNMTGEEKEGIGINLLMRKWIDDGNNTTQIEAPEQYREEHIAAFDLPQDLRDATGVKKWVDITTESMEGKFIYEMAKQDPNRLGKLITMDVEHAIGVEITMMDIQTKGGYKSAFAGKQISDLNDALDILVDFNDEMVKNLQNMIHDYGNDLGAVHLDLAEQTKTAKGTMTDQMRQVASRFVDIAYGAGGGEGGYEFVSPMLINGRNYLVSFGWNLELGAGGDYKIIPQTYEGGKTISFVDMGPAADKDTGTGIIKVGDKEVRNDMLSVMDLIGSTVYGSDADYLSYRTTLMFQEIMHDAYRLEEVDEVLGQYAAGFLDANMKGNVYPTAMTGFKLPSEIATDFSKLLMERLQEGGVNAESEPWVRRKMGELSNAWRQKTDANSWESKRDAIKEGDNPFTPSTGTGGIAQFVFPLISQGGTAARMTEFSKKPWVPVTL